jgi:hypothetical protein
MSFASNSIATGDNANKGSDRASDRNVAARCREIFEVQFSEYNTSIFQAVNRFQKQASIVVDLVKDPCVTSVDRSGSC